MSYTTPHYYPKKEIKTNEFVDEQSVQLIFVHCQCLTPRLPGVCDQFYQALPEAANNMLLLLLLLLLTKSLNQFYLIRACDKKQTS